MFGSVLMRDSLHMVRGRWFVASLGADAYLFLDFSGADEDRLDLTGSMIGLIGDGFDLPPYREWCPDGTEAERGRVGLVSLSFGRSGSVTVFPDPADADGVRVGRRLSEGEAGALATRAVHERFQAIATLVNESTALSDQERAEDSDPSVDDDVNAQGGENGADSVSDPSTEGGDSDE